MQSLRQENVLHRDIKPQNCLIQRIPKYGKDDVTIDFADFGISRILKQTQSGDLTKHIGSPVWKPPEGLGGKGHQSDVHGYGLIGLFLLTGGTTQPSDWSKLPTRLSEIDYNGLLRP